MKQVPFESLNIRDIIDHQGYLALCAQTGFDPKAAEKMIARALAGLAPAAKPRITHMLGIPGAGKTTWIKRTGTPANTLLLSFDAVMESLPPYQRDKEILGLAAAFEKWELCAREIGYEILFCALEARFNILFDNGGTRVDHAAMLECLKGDSYDVRIVHLYIDPETALARAARRDRHLPPHYIPERKLALDALLPRYMRIADHFEEYDASERTEKTVEEKTA